MPHNAYCTKDVFQYSFEITLKRQQILMLYIYTIFGFNIPLKSPYYGQQLVTQDIRQLMFQYSFEINFTNKLANAVIAKNIN